jgi:serine phosphatase RsbU (regulator of sigma subunit)
MNKRLFQELSSVDMFITVQVAVVDAQRRSLVVANAGHCPLLLTDGFNAIKSLAPEGPPLGILPEASFTEQTVSLDEFSCALFYTDGLTEARNEEGALFGQTGLENWLSQNALLNKNAAQLKQHFLAELRQFQGGTTPADDQTFVLLVPEAVARNTSRS